MIVVKPKLIKKNNPSERPKVENQRIGTINPATTEANNICVNACPEAAVPLILGKQSKAANAIIGITEAIPILYKAINPILKKALSGIKLQNNKLDNETKNIK